MNKRNKIITQNTMAWTQPHCELISRPQNSRQFIGFSWVSTSRTHGITALTQYTTTISTASICASSALAFSP